MRVDTRVGTKLLIGGNDEARQVPFTPARATDTRVNSALSLRTHPHFTWGVMATFLKRIEAAA